MSILIKGVEMPKCCLNCRFCWGGDSATYCIAQRDIDSYGRETLHLIKFTYHGYYEQQSWREDTCPLVEVPPHGRLIDADTIPRFGGRNGLVHSSDIDNAPTIIEAEAEHEQTQV